MFINAQEMAAKHPTTFYAPSSAALAKVIPGTFVKVCAGRERFWVLVRTVEGDNVTGEVNNDLQLTEEHGLKCGDQVAFQLCHIYDIYEEPQYH
ncbi:DUF2314 domain-containing protein [Klebsiella pneumoniae]|nr:DUF2314 domain-containing protein [Klebsiella pneumoniae]